MEREKWGEIYKVMEQKVGGDVKKRNGQNRLYYIKRLQPNPVASGKHRNYLMLCVSVCVMIVTDFDF